MKDFNKKLTQFETRKEQLENRYDYLERHIGEVFSKYTKLVGRSFRFDEWRVSKNSIYFSGTYYGNYEDVTIPIEFFEDFEKAEGELRAKWEEEKRLKDREEIARKRRLLAQLKKELESA